jgi:predicted metalloendopeptidase
MNRSATDKVGQRVTRPQDDLYASVNSEWLAKARIPNGRSRWGTFQQTQDLVAKRLREVVDRCRVNPSASSSHARIACLYETFLDEESAKRSGLGALGDVVHAIGAASDRESIARIMGELRRIGITGPVTVSVDENVLPGLKFIATVSQGGLGLPAAPLYQSSTPAFVGEYANYLGALADAAGLHLNPRGVHNVIGFESALAAHQVGLDVDRNPHARWSQYSVEDLIRHCPAFPWRHYLAGVLPGSRIGDLVVFQPTYVRAWNDIFDRADLETVRDYLVLRALHTFATDLPDAFSCAHARLFDGSLKGALGLANRESLALSKIDALLGDELGSLYAQTYLSPAEVAGAHQLIDNLMSAMEQSIRESSWLSEEARHNALRKLQAIDVKVGAPRRPLDRSAITISRTSHISNAIAAQGFHCSKLLSRLQTQAPFEHWDMPPHAVCAYYNPPRNEVVVPAGLIQPPFFSTRASLASNYGSLGVIIGHEISHAFDDEGRLFDQDGKLNDWWGPGDELWFERSIGRLKRQCASLPQAFRPNTVDRIIGEVIADVSGLAIAFRALSVASSARGGQLAKEMEQEFFCSFARMWRGLVSDRQSQMDAVNGLHPPNAFRANCSASNLSAFYHAFNVSKGDGMYIAPEDRGALW